MRKRSLLSLVALLLVCAAVYSAPAKKVDIFITSWCPYCRKLETFLQQNKIDYTRHDVEKDPVSADEFKRLGGQGVPLTRVGKKLVRGYDPGEILAALGA